MITSMTGFVSHTVPLLERQNEQCSLEIEIKTFNSRFFEPTCKLPGTLNAYEMEIISRLKKKIHRGRVYCTVRISGYSALLEKLVFLPTRFQEYLETLERVKDEFGVSGSLSSVDVINLPNVFSTERTLLPDDAIQRFLAGVDAAIDVVVACRQKEGEHLFSDIKQRIDHSKELIAKVKKANLALLAQCKAEIAEQQIRAQEGDENAKNILSDRYSMLDKIDVHEELVRFSAHLKAIEEHLYSAKTEKGRKFDFILQELMREINTIMAKCSSFEVSSYAVDIKVEIEKAREQVQNIV